ncbi:MAG: hypothetical protein ACLUES_11750 [Flavonifractor plautii]
MTIPADGTDRFSHGRQDGEVKLSVPTKDNMTVSSAGLVLVDHSRDFTDTKGHWAEDAIDGHRT